MLWVVSNATQLLMLVEFGYSMTLSTIETWPHRVFVATLRSAGTPARAGLIVAPTKLAASSPT